jgi:transcriptional regulator with XRE-family HTH domain
LQEDQRRPQTSPVAEGAQDWTRLGRVVAVERARQRFTVEALALHSGLGMRTLQSIESGSRTGYRHTTLSRLEAALGWQPGSVAAVLAGGDPTRDRDPQLERLAALWPSLTPRQQRALVAFVEEILRG